MAYFGLKCGKASFHDLEVAALVTASQEVYAKMIVADLRPRAVKSPHLKKYMAKCMQESQQT